MFKPIEIFIGLRYTRAKQRSGFISFISMTSMLGVALGVMALITVLSVMNGFEAQLREKFWEWPLMSLFLSTEMHWTPGNNWAVT